MSSHRIHVTLGKHHTQVSRRLRRIILMQQKKEVREWITTSGLSVVVMLPLIRKDK